MMSNLCPVCGIVSSIEVAHHCQDSPPTPQKLETGERLGDEVSNIPPVTFTDTELFEVVDEEAYSALIKKSSEGEFKDGGYYTSKELFLFGAAHARAQQKPGNSQITNCESDMEAAANLAYSYENKGGDTYNLVESVYLAACKHKEAQMRGEIEALKAEVSAKRLVIADRSNMERKLLAEIAELKAKHAEELSELHNHHLVQSRKSSGQLHDQISALKKELSAALASKAAAEGALEKYVPEEAPVIEGNQADYCKFCHLKIYYGSAGDDKKQHAPDCAWFLAREVLAQLKEKQE